MARLPPLIRCLTLRYPAVRQYELSALRGVLWNSFQNLPADRVKRMRSAVRAFTALREVRYHHNATLRAHEENCWRPRGGRKPLSQFHASRRISVDPKSVLASD